jgi:hypothetical protein
MLAGFRSRWMIPWRGFEGFGNLASDVERLRNRQRRRVTTNPLGQGRAGNELHHQSPHIAGFFDTVNLRDVWMIERREQLRFTPEAGEAFGIAGDRRLHNLDRDLAIENRVAGLVDVAHATRPDARADVIRTDATTFEAFGDFAVE